MLKSIIKFIHKNRKVIIVCLVIILSCIIASIIYYQKPAKKNAVPHEETAILAPPVVLSEQDEKKAEASSPSTGPLQYEYVKTYYGPDSTSPKFIYYTTERLDERLIQLTDKILSDLGQTGEINDQLSSYSINMFNNKDVAKIYFDVVENSKGSDTETLNLKQYYIAQLLYSKSYQTQQLIKVSTAKIIKTY